MSDSAQHREPATVSPGDHRPAGDEPHSESRRRERRGVVGITRLDKIGAVYVLIGIIVLFSLWKPSIYPNWTTAQSVFNQNAIPALAALALVIPLSTGMFDLSIGNVMALVSVTIAWLVVQQGVPIGLAIVIVILMSLVVGVLNALIVVVLGIDSFIATLGTGAVLQAVNLLISNDETVTDAHLSASFGSIAQHSVGGVQLPAFVVIVVAVAIWWALEHTVTGRRLYATGFNGEAARLAGVRTKRLRFISLSSIEPAEIVAGQWITAR